MTNNAALISLKELIIYQSVDAANAFRVVPVGNDGGGGFPAIATDTSGNVKVVGNVAHDAVDSGNPVKIGLRYRDHTNFPTPTPSFEDRVDATGDKYGSQGVYIAQYEGGAAVVVGAAPGSDGFNGNQQSLYSIAYNTILNNSSTGVYARLRSVVAAGASAASTGLLGAGAYQYNGSTWDAILKGQQAMASSVPVAIASDQSTLPVSIAAAPGVTATTVSQGETSITVSAVLVAANASRKKLTVQNHGAANVRLSHSGTATTSSPIILVPRVGIFQLLPENGYIYQGDVAVISETGTNLVGFVEET